ncbi:MAG TPA: hypothetical protein VMH82_08460 [Myxococcota bacterium]|nr:hypothetical protein [Myxococcota bacterium]
MPPIRPLPLLLLGLMTSVGVARADPDSDPSLSERFSIHGYAEQQLRSISQDYRTDRFYMSQWATVLNLELEGNIAPNGFGPFSLIQTYARIQARFDGIYTGYGIAPTWRPFGDRAVEAPATNWDDGRTNGYSGVIFVGGGDPHRITNSNSLLQFQQIPPFDKLSSLGSAAAIAKTLRPVDDATFLVKDIDGSLGNATFDMGPWKPGAHIDPTGSLRSIFDPTSPLPMRPAVPAPGDGGGGAEGLYIPSDAFAHRQHKYGDFDENFGQADLEWNHGGDQRPWDELKELYTDLEMLDGRLWMRIGKQDIVWGKTELFRTTDQFDPQDLALSSLPSLEESRIALWSMRAVYSFYDVGPLEDVRLEFAANFDRFYPNDLGKCGEPYTIWLVCGKAFGLWGHGVSGVGIAGERRPPAGYQSIKGVEPGARVEFRYGRFSFQISDFWGYDDNPTIDYFNTYSRNVDVNTGQPLDVNGHPLDPSAPGSVLKLHPGNRQFFDLVCSVTVGIAAATIPALADDCLVDVPNDNTHDIGFQGFAPAQALGQILGGSGFGAQIAYFIATGKFGGKLPLVQLNHDPDDGPGAGAFPTTSLSSYLTTQQMALLGCGPFYGSNSNCDTDGIDLFNAEASVLLQSFPQFDPHGAIATRPVNGKPVTLPGARGPGMQRYTPLQDGCVGPGPFGCNAGDDGRPTSARQLTNPLTGQVFANELAAVSYNFLELVAALGAANPADKNCKIQDPITCLFVQGIFGVAGITRPEVRAGGNGFAGRRDFVWLGGSEIQFRYNRRNVLGFAFDFAEDRFKTNWSVEATWFARQDWARTDVPQGWSSNHTFNLTISADRPTFINFLNNGRTFFMNSQWFIRYIDGYKGGGAFYAHGPFSALGTFTVTTGYFQDRLLPALTLVYDVRSVSGAVIGQLSYRFSPDFSATIGTAGFFGSPQPLPIPLTQPLLANNGGDFKTDSRYDGLSPIAERDELFLILRYSF